MSILMLIIGFFIGGFAGITLAKIRISRQIYDWGRQQSPYGGSVLQQLINKNIL